MAQDSGRNDEPIPDDWYRQGFGALYPVVYAHRTVEAAQPEAEFAIHHLRLTDTDRVLDLCCGSGRHMAHLARVAPRIAGVDYSPELLTLARHTLGPRAILVRGDMRAIPFDAVFDVLTSFFTSFGYFDTPDDNRRVVMEMVRVLRPGGRFFIDYLNSRNVEKKLVPESVRQYNEYVIRERRWIDAERRRVNKWVSVVRHGAEAGAWGESVQLFDESELRMMLAREGLVIDQVFGDCQGISVSADAPRLILVGHKG